MGNLIVINIALSLSQEVENLCIEINNNSKKIRLLGKTDYLLHITLTMSIIDEGDLVSFQKFLENISGNSMNMEINKIKYSKNDQWHKSLFEIVKTDEIQILHEKITNHFKKYFKKGATARMLFKGNETGSSESAKGWFDGYNENPPEKFWPHISLNCYDVKCNLPTKFKTDTIIFCHAWGGGTCRRILSRYKLN